MFSSISLQLSANNIVNVSNYIDFSTCWHLALRDERTLGDLSTAEIFEWVPQLWSSDSGITTHHRLVASCHDVHEAYLKMRVRGTLNNHLMTLVVCISPKNDIEVKFEMTLIEMCLYLKLGVYLRTHLLQTSCILYLMVEKVNRDKKMFLNSQRDCLQNPYHTEISNTHLLRRIEFACWIKFPA